MNSTPNTADFTNWIENLHDPDQVVRIHAATMLGAMGAAAVAAVPALIDMLQDGDNHDRKLAALTLGEIGPVAQDAIPALFAAVDDEEEGVAEMAEAALEAIDRVDDMSEAA
jgi:HEAT repeat protein